MKKKLLSLSLVLVFLCSGFLPKMTGFAGKTAGYTERFFEPVEMMTIGEYTYFRSNPSESSSVLRISPPGERVIVCGTASHFENKESVYYIVKGESASFVKVQFLTPVENDTAEIYVEPVLQNPELPNGCEVTSLTIVLNHLGLNVSKIELARKYLPKKYSFSYDPEEYYIGNPFDDTGNYCFCTALISCVNSYSQAENKALTGKNLTGKEISSVYEEVSAGNPAIVFVTTDWNDPLLTQTGYYENLHCVVLSGYTGKTVTIIDPLKGKTTVSRFLFEDIWYKMGQRAMVVYQ